MLPVPRVAGGNCGRITSGRRLSWGLVQNTNRPGAPRRSPQPPTGSMYQRSAIMSGRFRWRGVPFSAWLYRIAGNEIANTFRRDKRERTHLLETLKTDPLSDATPEAEVAQAEGQLLRHEEFLALHESISRLPLRYQEVITLRYFEDRQLKEIAAILGKSEGTVKSLLHRGIAKLRILME